MRRFIFFKGFTKEWYSTQVVNGEVRTLRAVWSPQLAEDLYTYHTIDAEDELTRMLSQQLAEEVDRTVMRTMLDTINIENETDMEVLRGMDVLNDNNELETTAMIRELTRLINGGNRA